MSAHSEVLPQERKHEILSRLRTAGRVSAAELASMFDISEDSIRRDLRELAARGLCRRVYGGALLPSPPLSPFRQRQDENAPRKQALAKVAASLVQPNQVLLIDAGSTNNAIAAALPERHGLTVATNAPSIAQQLMAREGFEVMLVGGRIDISAGGSVGAEALDQLRRIRADVCFPGACAIDSARGLWGMDSDQAVFKRAMIEASGTCVVVVLNDKLETPAPFQVADLHAIDYLIVEHDAPAAQVQAFEKRGIELRFAAPTDSHHE